MLVIQVTWKYNW